MFNFFTNLKKAAPASSQSNQEDQEDLPPQPSGGPTGVRIPATYADLQAHGYHMPNLELRLTGDDSRYERDSSVIPTDASTPGLTARDSSVSDAGDAMSGRGASPWTCFEGGVDGYENGRVRASSVDSHETLGKSGKRSMAERGVQTEGTDTMETPDNEEDDIQTTNIVERVASDKGKGKAVSDDHSENDKDPSWSEGEEGNQVSSDTENISDRDEAIYGGRRVESDPSAPLKPWPDFASDEQSSLFNYLDGGQPRECSCGGFSNDIDSISRSTPETPQSYERDAERERRQERRRPRGIPTVVARLEDPSPFHMAFMRMLTEITDHQQGIMLSDYLNVAEWAKQYLHRHFGLTDCPPVDDVPDVLMRLIDDFYECAMVMVWNFCEVAKRRAHDAGRGYHPVSSDFVMNIDFAHTFRYPFAAGVGSRVFVAGISRGFTHVDGLASNARSNLAPGSYCPTCGHQVPLLLSVSISAATQGTGQASGEPIESTSPATTTDMANGGDTHDDSWSFALTPQTSSHFDEYGGPDR